MDHEPCQRSPCRDADVEAAAVDGVRAVLSPIDVSRELVGQIPADHLDAVGECQGHAGIIGPLAGGEVERAPAPVSGDRGEGTGRLELDGGPKGVTNGKADERPSLAVHELCGLVTF